MKLKAFLAAGLAALALSGLSAGAAMGEESEGSEGPQVVHEHFCAETADSAPATLTDCAPPVTGTSEELKPLEDRWVRCIEGHPEMSGTGRAFAEYCLEVASSGDTATIMKKARRARRLHSVVVRRRHAH